jgi:hypothetical protein
MGSTLVSGTVANEMKKGREVPGVNRVMAVSNAKLVIPQHWRAPLRRWHDRENR